MGESCINCNKLVKENVSCPLQPISYTCPVLNNLMCISETKVIRLKLDVIKSFKCCEHEIK